MATDMQLYQSKSAIREVLGCLIQDPSLLKTHTITKNDFVEAFHKVVFVGVNNLFSQGVNKVDAYVLDNYIKEHMQSVYKIFTRNNGVEFVDKAKRAASLDNFKMNYTELRKFSALRAFLREGVDVDDLYDPEEVDTELADQKRAEFSKMTIDDILLHYRQKTVKVNEEFSSKTGRDSVKAGSVAAREQKEKWKQTPDIGLSYASNYLTTITDGMKLRRFSISSAGTGVGKSRNTIANLCHSFVARFWDSKKQRWVDNPHGSQNAAVYIGTEMELIEEIEPILWAYIADVPQSHIIHGEYEEGEEERVDEAIRILDEECQIYLEYVPGYDISTLESIIEYHTVQHGVKHFFFDYIHITPDLTAEYQQAIVAKMAVREDQVLGNLSAQLKTLCRKYNIHLESWTQVTGDFKNESVRDQTIIRGAKAIADKIDTGSITSRPTKKELKLLEPILRSPIMMGKPVPNICISVYKNRGSEYNLIKIWLYVDYDTMRTHDLFCTDYDYKILNIQQSFTEIIEDQKVKRVYNKEKIGEIEDEVEILQDIESDEEKVSLEQAFGGDDELILADSQKLMEMPEFSPEQIEKVIGQEEEIPVQEEKAPPSQESAPVEEKPKKRGRRKKLEVEKESKEPKPEEVKPVEEVISVEAPVSVPESDDDDEDYDPYEEEADEAEPLELDW